MFDAPAAVAKQIREPALMLAPELMLSEVANTLWKRQQAEALALARKETAILISMDHGLQQLAATDITTSSCNETPHRH